MIGDGHMQSMVRERMEAYKNRNGHYPDKILYYRDGVGRSQWSDVQNSEIASIKKMCEGLRAKIELTAIVATKRHHTRLYPGEEKNGVTCKNLPDNPKNVLPGTMVESTITSPIWFDFFLVSHNGIKGTSRPTHYMVLENGMGFNAQGLQDFVSRHCHFVPKPRD